MSVVTEKRHQPLRGSKGGSSKPKQPHIAQNGVASLSTARIVYLLSWGPIVGPVNGLKSIKLDGTPIQAEDGTLNYPDVKWQFRPGELNQERLEGVAESSNEIAVGQTLLSTQPYIYTVTNATADAVRVRLSWPNLQAQDSSGNINGVRIEYAIDVATDGAPYQTVLSTFVDRKNVTTYYRSHRINLPAGGHWAVRVRRITPEANSSLVQDTMMLTAIAEVVDSNQEFPLTAVGCVEYDAQQFGGDFPKFSALMRGRIVRVPMNYDPETRTYFTGGPGTTNGVWDGTFKEAYSNNPAWVFYDLVLNPYYGLGERIDQSMVNRWALYRIAQYCDQLVPDGKGGQEPRFTCNLYLQKQEEAYAVLQDLAAIFHGLAFWDGSQITVNADMPQDPVYTYSTSQILNDGVVAYSGTRTRDRHSLAMVSWDNPANAFETDKEPVFDEDAIIELGGIVREVSVGALGCTSQGQAQRAGQWALMTEQLQTRGAVWKVGLDGFIPRPGQVVALADPMLAGRANGGRISAVSGRAITVDRDVDIPVGARLRVNLPSGRSEARAIQGHDGRVITVVADFSEEPSPESGWAIDYDDLALMQFYVKNVTRPSWEQFQLEVIQHEPGKFDAIDHGAIIDSRPISVLPSGVQDPPARVLISQHIAVEQGLAVTIMTIAWDAAPDAVAYDVEWRWGSREWVRVPRTGELMVEVRGVYTGQYLARVRAVNSMNVSSIPANSVLTNITGKTGAPPALAFLRTTSGPWKIGLEWGFPASGAADTAYTEIQQSVTPGGSEQNATALGLFAYPTDTHTLTSLAAGARLAFRGRLIDRTGNVGPWSSWVDGISSTDASEYNELITKEYVESALGEQFFENIEQIGGNVDQLMEQYYDAGTVYQKGQIVRLNGRFYQALQDVPAGNPPPNPVYWADVGELVESVDALALRVTENAAAIEELDGVVQSSASSLDVLQAAARREPATGEKADALKGWDTIARAATEVIVRANEIEAQAKRVETVQAQTSANGAAIQTTQSVVASLDQGVKAMYSVKLQAHANGQQYATGFQLGFDSGTSVTTMAFQADRFLWFNSSSGQTVAPVSIVGGQMFINNAMIQDGSITNAKIGNVIQSTALGANGEPLWKLDKAGSLTMNSATSGGFMRQTAEAVKVYDANLVLRVQIGNLDA
ncbi:TPA: host specificity protein J [Pseudomonas aeruginosa]|uniref:host specificity protein J n=2 Tax=Pseudomonas aeruginosa TaxID=287 RepID=UPI00053EFD35|nr:phage tail protein [Pseudomonas aeruginosa]EIU1442268.1 phage tail protein [Pseudomonas aeruginosa]EIU3955372.1 phage tail protein [Pseudomonas aeruginosa]EIU3967460.1 phage tail protein [Pseudomonas aeruginosa]EKU8380873.1 phage tail protein [Pseudomonas aeruginosa]EKU8392967.1 phage tail protein [Pseudomonas aeruginosa]